MKAGRGIKYIATGTIACLALTLFTAARNGDFRLGRNIEILVNMFREVNLFYVDDVDPDKLLSDAAAGLTMSLDPYTEFMPEEDMLDFEVMTTGKYGGVGAIIRKKGEYVYIAQPYRGFPADKGGLIIGDKILEIDGVSAYGFEPAQVSNLLRGDPGTNVQVKVEKYRTGKIETVTLRRERIVMSGIPYYGFVNDSIGYIIHSDFTEDCSTDLRAAFMSMRETGNLKGLILDYRGNGGGIMQEAVKILSMFVPRGTEVVSMKGRLPEMTVSFRTETEPIDTEIPIAVLVSSGSASAAEIVAGALQDLDRGVLIGHRTFGKGLVQSTRPVGYNSYLKITTAKYYMPSGRCIQAIDYAQHNEDGSVAYVPDSLVREYTTLAGRKVYDGGGVMPDIFINPEYISRFTIIAFGHGYIDDFVDEYWKENNRHVDPETFRLTEKEWNLFKDFMSEKDMRFQSETKRALGTLRKSAERERYSQSIEELIDQIESRLTDDIDENLELYRDQISEIIEGDIVLREHYADGVSRYKISRDEEIEAAISLLGDPSRYKYIVTEQDTPRKQPTAETSGETK